MKTGGSSSGSVSVDKGFKFVKFDNKTFQRLRNSLKLVNNKLPKYNEPSTKKIKMINDIALSNPLNEPNGASYNYTVISHSKETSVALEKYHDGNKPSKMLEKDMILKHSKNKPKKS